jgi:hypothetical protein
MKSPPNFHMVLKWFKRPHFDQTKVQFFEESIYVISLQTLIIVSPLPTSIRTVTMQLVFS